MISKEKLVILFLGGLLIVQTIVLSWLGWQYMQAQKKLKTQEMPVQTPAMIRGK